MADQRGPDAGSVAAVSEAAATASSGQPAPAKKAPAGELLCTICGLTACWKKPPETTATAT